MLTPDASFELPKEHTAYSRSRLSVKASHDIQNVRNAYFLLDLEQTLSATFWFEAIKMETYVTSIVAEIK